MRTPSPWIIRCSVRVYSWLLCLGPHTYRYEYAAHTLQLFRECCQEAYREHGISGVLALWLPLFSDVVIQMLAEHLSELRRSHESHAAAEMVSPHTTERTPPMDSVWHRINHTWIIPPLSALTRFRRKHIDPLSHPKLKFLWREFRFIKRELLRPFFHVSFPAHPTNMLFEQDLQHWIVSGLNWQYVYGVDTSGPQGLASAFLKSTVADAEVVHLQQALTPHNYRGKYLRFSCQIKAEDVEQRAHLSIRVMTPPVLRRAERLRQGMGPRQEKWVQGTQEWMRYELTLPVPVPEEARSIIFGLSLRGTGQVWLANPQLEVIEPDGMLSA